MITECSHRESWVITIDREPGESWPDADAGYGRHKRAMFPQRIHVEMHRGSPRPYIQLLGVNYLKNGQLGRRDERCLTGSDLPWVMAMVRETRERLHLGPGSTGVDW